MLLKKNSFEQKSLFDPLNMSTVYFDTSPNPGDNEEALDEYNKLHPVFPFKHPAILRVRKTVICSGNTQANKRCKNRVSGSSRSYCSWHSPILPAPDSTPIVEEVHNEEQLQNLIEAVQNLIEADDIYTVKDVVNNV